MMKTREEQSALFWHHWNGGQVWSRCFIYFVPDCRSQPRCPRLCRAMPFSARAQKRLTFSLTLITVDIVVNNKNVKIEIWFIVVCTLIKNEYASLLFSQTCFCIVSARWACLQVFERKAWRVQVAPLHNTARALSCPSRCFHCQHGLWSMLSTHCYEK